MQLLLAIALFCQVVMPPRAYIYNVGDGYIDLATENGRYRFEPAPDCTYAIQGDVDYLPGSGGIVYIGLVDGSKCGITEVKQLSDVPCDKDADGNCDIMADPLFAQ